MINPVSYVTPTSPFKTSCSAQKNPINRRTERNLAILNATGVSSIVGALTTIISRCYTSSWKNSAFMGVGAAAISMLFVCPKFMYKSGINTYTKQQELDVFTREKDVQKKLLDATNDAIDDNNDELAISKLESYSKILGNKS